jgi:hypothetical protein
VDNDLVLSILKAISQNFSDFLAYAAHDRDMLIVAKKKGALAEPDPWIFQAPPISGALERVYIRNMQDIALRKLGSKQLASKSQQTRMIRMKRKRILAHFRKEEKERESRIKY